MVMASKAAVTGKAGKWDSVDAEVDLKMDMITAPYGFGFHCTKLGPVLNATSSNATDKENATTVSVTLMGFQVLNILSLYHRFSIGLDEQIFSA